MAELTPQQRIELAEAEEVEALRDILRAAARSAAAEAQIMENLVELDQSMNNAFMGLTGQGPLPGQSPAVAIKELIALVGKDLARDLLEMGKDYVLEKLRELTGRQHGRADETRANAEKEGKIKGDKTGVVKSPGVTVAPSTGVNGAVEGGSSIAPVTGSSVT
jgi:hypothetical protein